ncbi:MAG TPA: ABC transporter ATP-binding protein [Ktedonobacterales bacterium]|jgi:putative ABC transport system ATP-binding protein|nr:ABC transporter ATP-binding protein [Ktedonobacterales bacterium]
MNMMTSAEHAPSANIIVACHNITRDFKVGGGITRALRGIDMWLRPGELVALRGRSGSGKTTLLNILTGIDSPTQGQVTLLGHDLARLNETARAILRREQVGILFQNAHLFPLLTAQENAELPLRLGRAEPKRRAALALAALDMVHMSQRAQHRGLELSGGEQQRVALARALAHQPRFVVADEPTGNLDSTTGREIALLLQRITHEQGIGMLVATHDNAVVSIADRVLTISDGMLS